jgi:hypothetical protein
VVADFCHNFGYRQYFCLHNYLFFLTYLIPFFVVNFWRDLSEAVVVA